MKILEKILEEVENHAIEFETFGVCDDYVSVGWIKEIIRSHMSEKEKVSSAEIISRDIGGKPYYEIKYKKVGEDHYTVGYSSYFLDYVIDWLNNYFEFCGEPKIVVNVGKDINVPNKDSWIPVEERLPNKREFQEAYCRNHYAAEFLVTIEGATRPTTLYFKNNSWFDEERNYYEVIAWQPLPEQYRPKEKNNE